MKSGIWWFGQVTAMAIGVAISVNQGVAVGIAVFYVCALLVDIRGLLMLWGNMK